MKDFFKIILTFTLIATLAFSCEREAIEPNTTNDIELEAKITVGNTVPALATSPIQQNLLNENGDIVGTLEVSNNTDFIYLATQFAHGWLLTDAKFYAGHRNNLPKVNGNEMDLEELPFQMHLQNPAAATTMQIPRSPLPMCTDYAVWFRAVQYDWWGNVAAQIEGWADGTAILNGFVFNYCAGSAPNVDRGISQNTATN